MMVPSRSLEPHRAPETADQRAAHSDLRLQELAHFPGLARVHEVWRAAGAGRPPRGIDPLSVPASLLPDVLLLDIERAPVTRLRIRLAGTQVCAKYGGELKGRTTSDFFTGADARQVLRDAETSAASGKPHLCRRDYVALDGRLWRYVRIILPLSRTGGEVDGFFKVIEPDSLFSVG